jgi:hypothetical protein
MLLGLGFFFDLKEIAESEAKEHCNGDARGRVEEARTAGMNNLMQVHAEAKGYDRSLQQESSQALAFDLKRMRGGKSIDQTAQQRQWRRNQAARRQDHGQEKKIFAHE